MYSSQRALIAILESSRPITKADISKVTHFTVNTLHKTLTILKKAGFIVEIQGKYRPTDKAKQLYAADPTLETLQFELTTPVVKTENNGAGIVFTIPMEQLNAYSIYKLIVADQDGWRQERKMTRILLPFVLVYLIQEGYVLPDPEGNEELPEDIMENIRELFKRVHKVNTTLREIEMSNEP